LAGGAIEHGSEADGIHRINQLSDESFFSGLAEFKLQFEFSPDIAGRRNVGRFPDWAVRRRLD
jgi:hypothetical protein